MQCLDDQSVYSLLNLPLNNSSSTQSEWNAKDEKEVNRVANKVADRSNRQQQHFANCKAMSRRSVPLRQTRQQCPRFSSAANLLSVALVFLLFATFVELVALHSLKPSHLHPEPASPLQPVLALNSSVAAQGTIDDLHSLLAPLTDEHEHDEDSGETSTKSAQKTDSQSKVFQNEVNRRKREVSFDDESSTTKMPKSKKGSKNKTCYKKVLFHCGRTFVHSYKFVRVRNNNDNDILVAQCALRTAFFDCLKSRAIGCNKKKEANGKVKRNEGFNLSAIEKLPTTTTKGFEQHLSSLRKRLAETIWDSRICIFKNSLKITPLPV